MAHGNYQGRDAHHPEIRALFGHAALLASDWYRQRLATQQARDIERWQKQIAYLEDFLVRPSHRDVAAELDIAGRLTAARQRLTRVQQPTYVESLRGTLGADPLGARH